MAPRPARPTRSRSPSEVEALLDEMEHPERKLIDALRRLIARAVPAATESVKWNAPSFATTEHFATLHLRAKEGILLILHRGARSAAKVELRTSIRDPEGLLTWKGPDRAIVTLRDRAHLTAVAGPLTRILKAWPREMV